MFNQLIESESVRKLKELVHQRFQRKLTIQSILPAELTEDGEGEYQVVNGDLVIPIWVQNRFFATARVPQVIDLTDSEKEAINHLVKLVLEPTFYGWYLGQLADNASALKNYNTVRPMHLVVPKGEEGEALLSSKLREPDVVPPFLFLEAKSQMGILKMASQIHDLTSNWAYLRFHEITDSNTTPEEIWNMGSVSLLVEDILNLSPEQRLLLLSLIRAPRAEDSPFIMIGSTSTLDSMEADEMLPSDLITLFRNQKIDIDRLPSDVQKREEIFEMLLGPAVQV